MASVSSLGVGSNLPLDTLLTNLSTAEKGRLTPITAQQSSYSAKLTAYGSLKSAIEKFQTANTALNDATLFKSSTVTSSSTDLVVSTDAGAAAGKYTISVTQLAQAQSLATTGSANATDKQSSVSSSDRTLVINQPGRKEPLEIKLSDDQTSLNGIRDAINTADSGISASVIKNKSGEYQLVISSAETGTDKAMTISVKGDSKLNDLLGYDSSTNTGRLTQTIPAQNALLTINNIEVESGSNTVKDTPEGVTLTLTKEVANATVTVAKSNDKATAAIKTWVDAYNSMLDTFSSLTKYSAVEAGADQSSGNGVLLGDSVVRTIQTGIRGQFTTGDTGSKFSTLSQIGIAQDPTTGKLKIDDKKLSDALTKNSVDTQKLLVGDGKTTGITTTTANLVKGYLADDGIIDSATTSINATLKSLTKQYLATSTSIDDTIARYKAQFTQLDTMMSKLNNTSNYLTQQFSSSSS
ncbi:flagellar filament capping protein FliD [Buttiauxella agrestis]|uniref:Flagellar hook-associated protein 2 n=1 Tax=Buttiauxella agrestis ATCC 33320 TaxID=1006004 RepID=A0A085GD57_9ENTR|nr:flagellar filament capping protein FliD [Buttiauxella agrestis]KFC81652.1 FliD family flagellar hook-associated protein [Buttiauxella agrestis ATCC 33320]